MKPSLLNDFQNIFNTTEIPRFFFAPGRINLIGEHTDYNGGHVLPAAISLGTYALAYKRDDQKLRFYSLNFSEMGIIECDLNDLSYNSAHSWANFPKGMIKYFNEHGYPIISGMDILFYGDIPNGAGLSSSASIEMVTGALLEAFFEFEMDRLQMVQLGQKVENEYMGVNSGIMDQFAIGKGRKGHALLLDCQSLTFKYAPVELKEHIIMIINTNKVRTLAASKYNERRRQCEQALADLQTELAIEHLGELNAEQFEQHKHFIKNEVNRKRAKHAVYENLRTVEAHQQLGQNNLKAFGELMNESHKSLQHDYEVTGPELDSIVEAAWNQPGVLGARMTGAGFGGCAIAIVENGRVEEVKKNINHLYTEKFGYGPSFYTAAIEDGAKEIEGGML